MCSVVQPPPIKIQTFALFSSIKSSAFLMVIDGIIVTRIDVECGWQWQWCCSRINIIFIKNLLLGFLADRPPALVSFHLPRLETSWTSSSSLVWFGLVWFGLTHLLKRDWFSSGVKSSPWTWPPRSSSWSGLIPTMTKFHPWWRIVSNQHGRILSPACSHHRWRWWSW